MNPGLLETTRSLVARLRRRRPMRSGSLLITVLGDAIAPRGGAITLGSLIELGLPFGLTERLVRTSVARVAQLGWLASRRSGRRSEYHLTELGRRRFAEATQRIYGASPLDWDRRWTLLLLPVLAAGRAHGVRTELKLLGFGQLRTGLFAHPGRRLTDARRLLSELGVPHATLLQALSEGLDADRLLVRTGWDLGMLARRYARFIEDFGAIRQALGAATIPSCARPYGREDAAGRAAFTIRTLLIHEYRKIHLRDPLLPPDLLPPRWIGAQAHALCGDLYRKVFEAAERFISERAETLRGKIGPSNPEAYERFGGLGG
jgi:phenylacetic acid degradation operon negative regulatory protein